jgi:hypothetical protein
MISYNQFLSTFEKKWSKTLTYPLLRKVEQNTNLSTFEKSGVYSTIPVA